MTAKSSLLNGQRQKRTVGMVIARMGSTRVQGKPLLEIAGQPVLAHMIRIARQIKRIDTVVVVTSSLPADDPIVSLAVAQGVKVVRGHPEHVLDRIHQAACELAADIIVYIGGDCPLLDPVIVDRGIAAFFDQDCDYLNNYEPPTFPEGMDVNVITCEAVAVAFELALAPSQRIHAFSYLTRHPEEFSVCQFENDLDLSRHHWSLDFPEDLAFIRLVYARLYGADRIIRMEDVLALLARDSEVEAMDRALQRGAVAHAFWNSPGIMRDMNADIEVLSAKAAGAIEAGDNILAQRCFNEIVRIAGELSRFITRVNSEVRE